MRIQRIRQWGWGLVGLLPLIGLAVEPTVSVLEKDGNPITQPGPPPPYLELLEQHGLLVNYPDAAKTAPLSWEALRRHNMLVVIRPPQQQAYTVLEAAAAQEQQDLIDRYLQEGGGVLVFAGVHVGDRYDEHQQLNEWLQRYGVQYEWAIVDDDAQAYTNPPPVPWQWSAYLRTTNFTDAAVTKGAQNLFIPHGLFWVPSVRPVRPGPDWQVLMHANATATARPLQLPLQGQVPERLKDGGTPGAIPLLAVRQVGKGRLAVCGIQATALWYDLGKAVGDQVASVKGDGTHGSDWLPLLRNLAVWLSEPARTAGRPGGDTARARPIVNPQYGSRGAIDWERPDIAWPDREIDRLYGMHAGLWDVEYWRAAVAGQLRPYRLLAGAHSAASGGKGTVAEWKAAAQREGFDGIVFRERILDMSREQWEAFEAACQAASDDTFLAVPGQEFTDWEGNRFMRFSRRIPYPNAARLTPDGKRVKDQLSFFFDAGWPANFPLTPSSNPNPFWAYSVYSSYPIAVYQGGRRIEDNTAAWQSLVERIEYPTPLGVHLLEDPAEVAGTGRDINLTVSAPSLRDVRENPRWWETGALGHGLHNVTASYASDGPTIEAFTSLNHYRATIGDRTVPGSYRYRVFIRARAEEPIARVELWGGEQLLRCYQPNAKRFFTIVDEEHDRQRGLWLRVVDSRNRTALATSIMAHDKMMVWYWCGDHCNALPYGQGLGPQGSPTGLGLATHVKRQFSPATGPGGTFVEAWAYIPSGTDTSLPGLNTFGEVSFAGTNGRLPAAKVWFVPDVRFWYANRDILITRQDVTRWADQTKYMPKEQPSMNGWYPYVKTEPTEDFDVTSDDIDFHRDAGQPALQLCRGVVRFKRDVILNDKELVNVALARLGWNTVKDGMATSAGRLTQPGNFAGKLGRGGYFSWVANLGNGSVFALDDDFAVSGAAVNAQGRQDGMPAFGYALGGRRFQKGDTFSYAFLMMKWPVGMGLDAKLDAKVQAALNLAQPASGATLRALQGQVLSTQVFQDLRAEGGAFRGVLARGDFGMRVPVRVAGLNPNWTAGVWHKGVKVFGPLAPDPDGLTWTSLDPATEAGEVLIGHPVTANEPALIVRLLQRTDGGWDVLAHNPTGKAVKAVVRGMPGGPVPALHERVRLTPGAETRWRVE